MDRPAQLAESEQQSNPNMATQGICPMRPETQVSTCEDTWCGTCAGNATCSSTCSGQPTCSSTCAATCANTCANTCYPGACQNYEYSGSAIGWSLLRICMLAGTVRGSAVLTGITIGPITTSVDTWTPKSMVTLFRVS